MGVLRPFCIATDGVRAYAISYAFDNKHDEGSVNQMGYPNPQYAVLVQSNPFPDFMNARPSGTYLHKEHIQEALGWKTVNVVSIDHPASWFRDKYTDGGSRTYSCGVVNRAGSSNTAGAYIFTLHVTDPPTSFSPHVDDWRRRLKVIKFRPSQEPELREDERPETPKGDVPWTATLAGQGVARSNLFPLTGSNGGDGPWVEAMATESPLSVQLSTTTGSGAFPALVQDVKSLMYRPLAVALENEKLHILGRSGNCTQLTTVKTTATNGAMVMAEDPRTMVSTLGMCISDEAMGNSEPSSLNDFQTRIALNNGTLYSLSSQQEEGRFRRLVDVTLRLQQFGLDQTGNQSSTLYNVRTLGDLSRQDTRHWEDMLPLLPLSCPDHPSVDTGKPSEMSFITGHAESLFLISRQSTQANVYMATPFNITVHEPYKYYPFRDPELLSKAEIGGIAAGCVAGLLVAAWGVRKYLQRRKRNTDRQDSAETGSVVVTAATPVPAATNRAVVRTEEEDEEFKNALPLYTPRSAHDKPVPLAAQIQHEMANGVGVPPEYEMEDLSGSPSSSSSFPPGVSAAASALNLAPTPSNPNETV